MRSAQFFSFFASLTVNLPKGDLHKGVERFMALAKTTFEDFGVDEVEGKEEGGGQWGGGLW